MHFHCGIEPINGIPIGKPHGSVDYALHSGAVDFGDPDYPLRQFMIRINAPMVRLVGDALTAPRQYVEVVPPLAATQMHAYQWVWPIFHVFRNMGWQIDRCIFAGLSAWPVDQQELCAVLRALTPHTEIVVANPSRRAARIFDFHARRLGKRPVVDWPDGPQ